MTYFYKGQDTGTIWFRRSEQATQETSARNETYAQCASNNIMPIMVHLWVLISCLVLAQSRTIKYPDTRIVNGVEATPGEFPHMVSILIDSNHLCGGSVVGNGWVVTAAHCVADFNISRLAVVTDLHDFGNPGDYEWFEIQEKIVHESYNQGGGAFPNDVALLRLWLNGRNTFDNIIPVADGSLSFVGDICVMSGWGVTEIGIGTNQLRKAEVVAISQAECTEYYGASNILDQQICAKGYDHPQGAGGCNYDNGGPLVCRRQLAGIISWGDSDCNIGVVGLATVCASTAYFFDWIRNNCDCL